MVKIRGSEMSQTLTELMVEAVGTYALPYDRDWLKFGANIAPVGPAYAAPLAPAYANMRKTTIYGGSNEVQRNIIAQVTLG
jgi:alkylation response protein AidB-like acyl-CoA dehydrogenase